MRKTSDFKFTEVAYTELWNVSFITLSLHRYILFSNFAALYKASKNVSGLALSGKHVKAKHKRQFVTGKEICFTYCEMTKIIFILFSIIYERIIEDDIRA